MSAFAEVMRYYESLAFGYALGFVRHFHQAQDAAQEALVAAFYSG